MALRALKRSYEELLEKEKTLSDILSALRAGYNPNYQDMAVLNAVRGWEYHAGLPHINDVGKEHEEEEDNIEELGSDEVEGGEVVERLGLVETLRTHEPVTKVNTTTPKI